MELNAHGWEPPADKLAELERREEVASLPAPGPLLEALLPGEITVAGFTLRPVVASDLIVLQRIGSPLVAELAELRKAPEDRKTVPMTEEDGWALLWLWSRPVREGRALAARGREAFIERALADTADRFSIGVLARAGEILAALRANFERSFSTLVVYEPKVAEGTGFPSPPPRPATASVGG